MGRKPSKDPKQIMSISLPLSTRAKVERFPHRNRSALFNQAILHWMKVNDAEFQEYDKSTQQSQLIREMSTSQLTAILANRLEPPVGPQRFSELLEKRKTIHPLLVDLIKALNSGTHDFPSTPE